MDTPEVDAALELVCTLPPSGQGRRRIDVQAVIALATSLTEMETGVAFTFPNANDVAQSLLDFALAERDCCPQFRYEIVFAPAHHPIELRIDAAGALVKPLKDLYVGLAREAGLNT
jgi:hypothetical protein